jgi:hypothetical protein
MQFTQRILKILEGKTKCRLHGMSPKGTGSRENYDRCYETKGEPMAFNIIYYNSQLTKNFLRRRHFVSLWENVALFANENLFFVRGTTNE